jgi:hypothetical protein
LLAPKPSRGLSRDRRAATKGLGQRAVARDSGLSHRTIERVMKGQKCPTGHDGKDPQNDRFELTSQNNRKVTLEALDSGLFACRTLQNEINSARQNAMISCIKRGNRVIGARTSHS